MPTEDTTVLARFRAGDPEAIREIHAQYGGAVRTVARSVIGNDDLVNDVVQETFVKAWKAAASFDVDREIGPWLYTIARRTAIDVLRKERRPTMGGHAPEVDVAIDPPSFERTWEAFEVRRALDALPHDEREVAKLSHLAGLTHAEIADRLEIPVGTVKSRTFRAHKRLIAALEHLIAP